MIEQSILGELLKAADKITQLESIIKVLEESNAFYADTENYYNGTPGHPSNRSFKRINDKGKRAREAQAQIKKLRGEL